MNLLQCCACLWRYRERRIQKWLLWQWPVTKTRRRCKDTTLPLISFPPSIHCTLPFSTFFPPFLLPSLPPALSSLPLFSLSPLCLSSLPLLSPFFPPFLSPSFLSFLPPFFLPPTLIFNSSLFSYDTALFLIRFSTQDEENMCFVLRFCASVLANTLAFQRELAIKKQNETFLQIAKNLFSNLSKSCDVTWSHMTLYVVTSHDHHMMLHDHHMLSHVTWSSHDHHVTIMWLLHDYHMIQHFVLQVT